MVFTAENFRVLDDASRPDWPIREMKQSPLILVKADGRMLWANGVGNKDAVVAQFNEAEDVLLWVWAGQWRSDVFRLTRADLDISYRRAALLVNMWKGDEFLVACAQVVDANGHAVDATGITWRTSDESILRVVPDPEDQTRATVRAIGHGSAQVIVSADVPIDVGCTSMQVRVLSRAQDFPLRFSVRARVVHAGREVDTHGWQRSRTACGRWLYSANEHPADRTAVSCKRCLQALGRT